VRVGLDERESSPPIVTFACSLEPSEQPVVVGYRTTTGALLRVDGIAAGAYDREHDAVVVSPGASRRGLTLEVERSSMPSTGLPPGPGWRWRRILARARARPARSLDVAPLPVDVLEDEPPQTPAGPALWGHSHLDVAWLWRYAETRRKALRTFATAAALLERDPAFVFVQSQPQLYAFVREADLELFERVAAFARDGRFDCDVAAMWVEPDCNLPSGESLLRQLSFARAFCLEAFGAEPSIAWLPDTFGFARTLPTLLAHAGVRAFATTKLQWNDTTRFAHAQFRWRGPDGSEVLAAQLDSMDGDPSPDRVRRASARDEPLIVGHGDGGGGPTAAQLVQARKVGRWERPRGFFERLAARAAGLPVHDDELYLQYHRGVYTTHHDVKAQNAELERALARAEERAAWCVAIGVAAETVRRVREALREAWAVVLRNQFHDVLAGTSVAGVYDDVREEYERARALIGAAETTMSAALPRAAAARRSPALLPPVEREGAYVFENAAVRAVVTATGTIVELNAGGGPNAVAQANALALYRDRPKRWEAWNVDDGYQKSRRAGRPRAAHVTPEGALEIPFDLGSSRATMQISLAANDPFLRAGLAVDWRERRRLLRVENWLALRAETARFGVPHGTVERSLARDTPERRAQFEVPGQRFAVAFGSESGIAILALDTYGWSARSLPHGGVALGHSLLRSSTWPDPHADRGTASLAWAYAPLVSPSVGRLERIWERFANEPSVRLFEAQDDAVLVAACKPADDGDGAIVRVRECDGAARSARVRCAGRMRSVACADGLERPCGGEAKIDGESLVFEIGPYALRTFRVRF